MFLIVLFEEIIQIEHEIYGFQDWLLIETFKMRGFFAVFCKTI